MHTVFALLCFVVVIHWLIFPYPSGLLHWHCGNLTIAPVPAKQSWWIWINTSCEFIMNDCITTTKQSTTKPCAYFLGYTVPVACHPKTLGLPVITAPRFHMRVTWPYLAILAPRSSAEQEKRSSMNIFEVIYVLIIHVVTPSKFKLIFKDPLIVCHVKPSLRALYHQIAVQCLKSWVDYNADGIGDGWTDGRRPDTFNNDKTHRRRCRPRIKCSFV